jgi:hypothetical protein
VKTATIIPEKRPSVKMLGWFAGVAKRKGVYMPELQWDELDFLFDRDRLPCGVTLELSIKPGIRLRFV